MWAWASGIGFPAHETPHEPPNVRTSGTVGGRGPLVQSSIRFPDRRMRPRLECQFIGSVHHSRLTNVAADKHFRMRLRRNGGSVLAAELRR